MVETENALHEMRSVIAAVREDSLLREEARFEARLQAIDRLEFEVLDRLTGMAPFSGDEAGGSAAVTIRDQAQGLIHKLEACNDVLFGNLRERIRSGSPAGADFPGLLREHAGLDAHAIPPSQEPGYDAFDALVNGIFSPEALPPETRERETEMVFYQKTPARVVHELVARASFSGEDVFYDLGSGLGQVPLLVSLLAGVRAAGVEYEPAYCAYAERRAADLGIARARFLNADVRHADLSDGTVFFLYTPCTGSMLREVLAKLQAESNRRAIRIFTYGPCTFEVSRQDWLRWENPDAPHTYRLGFFRSV